MRLKIRRGLGIVDQLMCCHGAGAAFLGLRHGLKLVTKCGLACNAKP
jgi:hypothetical protein